MECGRFWTGTPAQLVRMEQDARCVVEGPPPNTPYTCTANGSNFTGGMAIDPSAKIVSPSPVGGQPNLGAVGAFLTTYFGTTVGGAPGGAFADAIGFHGYVSTPSGANLCPDAENVTTVIDDLSNAVNSAPLAQGKPWFDTEGSWGKANTENFEDEDRQAAFLARFYLLQLSLGVDRVYWYKWDSPMSDLALWNPSSGITEAGTAYGVISNWIVGNTLTSACAASLGNANVWTCGFSNGAWKGLAVWDASQDCSNGSCTTSTFNVPPGGYSQYLDIAGDPATSISGGTVPIGAKPILLENSSLP